MKRFKLPFSRMIRLLYQVNTSFSPKTLAKAHYIIQILLHNTFKITIHPMILILYQAHGVQLRRCWRLVDILAQTFWIPTNATVLSLFLMQSSRQGHRNRLFVVQACHYPVLDRFDQNCQASFDFILCCQ